MEVVIDQKGEETVIKIKGRLDTNTARECEEKVLPVWENPGVKVSNLPLILITVSSPFWSITTSISLYFIRLFFSS